MIAHSYFMRDSTTMLRRNIRHAVRYPAMTLSGMAIPVLFLLLFDGVFGNTLRAGLGTALHTGGRYIDYLTPGIILLTAAAGAQATALNICTDMSEGIIARFRTMAIAHTSVLTGQVLGSLIRTLISGALVVIVALLLGFRASTAPIDWVAAAGLFALITVALSWLAVAFGLVSGAPEGASSLSMVLLMLPFVSSAFVPAGSMPTGVRWFAQNQPFTPLIETLRGLLTGGSLGHNAILAIGWSVGISALAYLWARALYSRSPAL